MQDWIKEIQEKYSSGISVGFILHLNIDDYVEPGVTLRMCFGKFFEKRKIIVFYDRAKGLNFPLPSMKTKFEGALGLQPDPLTGQVELPKDPVSALGLLEKLLKIKTKENDVAAVIVEYAETLVPAADLAMMTPQDRNVLVILESWAKDPEIIEAGNPIFLITNNLSDLHQSIRAASCKYEAIRIPMPNLETRNNYIAAQIDKKDAVIEYEMDATGIARGTAGLSLMNIEDIFLRARQEGKLTWDLIKERKKDIMKSEFNDVLEILEPTYGFEMVGGLDYIKDYFLRNVINPMKEGDYNAVPMGVLLLGPPGTGKTILAEAVAKESGMNMAILNLAKIYSKWVGDSLASDEEIVLLPEDGSLAMRLTISQAYEKKLPASVLTVDDHGRACIRKIIKYIRHDKHSTILRVKTKTGRECKVTHEHGLFEQIEGHLHEIRGDQLKIGTRIAIPCGSIDPQVSCHISLIDLILSGDKGQINKWTVTNGLELLGKEETLRCAGRYQNGYGKSKGYYYIKSGRIPLDNFLLVANRGLFPKAKISRRSGNFVYANDFEITEQLGFLAGFWMAQGSKSNDFLRVTHNIRDVELLKDQFKGIPISIFKEPGANAINIFIEDGALAHILTMLGSTGHAHTKRIPAWVFGVPANIAAAFLRGYFSGDGSFSRHVLEAGTVSRNIAGDVTQLLTRFGIIGAIRPRKDGSYRIQVSAVPDLKRFVNQVGFMQPYKNLKIQRYIDNVRFIRKRYESENVFWDEVREITEEPYDDYVYDIEIEDTHRFISGFGGLLVHNSERNLEKALEAINSLSPILVFIDEIDAALPNRSDQGGGDSGVSSRIFKRMLEFMSDTSHRGKIFMLGASNRPDRLDAALKRPGRFDTKIPLLVPDEDTRAKIFEVMNRKYQVGLKDIPSEWVDDTKGWTGAEIEKIMLKAKSIVRSEKLSPLDAVNKAFIYIIPKTEEIENMSRLAVACADDLQYVPKEWWPENKKWEAEHEGE